MGVVHSVFSGCTRCWDAGDTHIVITPSGGWAHAHARPKILFYDKHKPYYEFTNFSPHEVVFEGKRYPTSEHLFQAFKFLDGHPQIGERIRTCGPKPISAFDEAHRHKTAVRSDWSQVHVSKMETALKLKFTQHRHLKQMLLDTGDAELVEDSPRDWFWGVGADGTGNNELGKALMRLRDELRNEANDVMPTPAPAPAPGSKPSHRSRARPSTNKRQAPRIHVSGSRGSMHGICEFCHAKPAQQRSKYCSHTCANNASTLCKYCRRRARARGSPYCSRICADKARGK